MKRKFTIRVEMEERWVSHFISMLKEMEHLGDIGASRTVSLYSDGDGDFRPKFISDIDVDLVKPNLMGVYDAG